VKQREAIERPKPQTSRVKGGNARRGKLA
jgi:hypothetical protein